MLRGLPGQCHPGDQSNFWIILIGIVERFTILSNYLSQNAKGIFSIEIEEKINFITCPTWYRIQKYCNTFFHIFRSCIFPLRCFVEHTDERVIMLGEEPGLEFVFEDQLSRFPPFFWEIFPTITSDQESDSFIWYGFCSRWWRPLKRIVPYDTSLWWAGASWSIRIIHKSIFLMRLTVYQTYLFFQWIVY